MGQAVEGPRVCGTAAMSVQSHPSRKNKDAARVGHPNLWRDKTSAPPGMSGASFHCELRTVNYELRTANYQLPYMPEVERSTRTC